MGHFLPVLVPLPQESIDKAFAECKGSMAWFSHITSLAIPRWSEVTAIYTWPSISKVTWEYILQKAEAISEEDAAIWRTRGYEIAEGVPDFTVDITNLVATYGAKLPSAEEKRVLVSDNVLVMYDNMDYDLSEPDEDL